MVGDPFSEKRGDSSGLGDTEAAVAVDLAGLTSEHPFAETLGQIARRLARSLDEDRNDIKAPLAGTARELRMTVAELTRMGTPDDGGFEEGLGTPTMPAEVRNPEGSDPPDAGAGGREGS